MRLWSAPVLAFCASPSRDMPTALTTVVRSSSRLFKGPFLASRAWLAPRTSSPKLRLCPIIYKVAPGEVTVSRKAASGRLD